MKVYKLSSLLFLTILLVVCDEVNAQDFYVNNFEIVRSGYNHDEIVAKIGTPDSIRESGPEIEIEFGHKIYRYYYGNSFIRFFGESSDPVLGNSISDIFIKDTSLSINSITVGDTISKVKETFPKDNYPGQRQGIHRGRNYLRIYYGTSDLSVGFYYDANNVITRISYVVLT